MTEQFNMADNSDEEGLTFNPRRESERDNSTVSPAETDQDGDTDSPDRDSKNNQDDAEDKKPFNEHPRWKQREDEWTERFNDQEKRHQETLAKALQDIDNKFNERSKATEVSKIPSWFGGTQEAWNEYQADQKAESERVKAEAIQATIDQMKSKTSTEEDAVKKATDYMNSEVDFLSKDEKLNPEKVKFDTNALVKFTIENELVNTKGQWNYRAAFQMMKASGLIKAKEKITVTPERKALADATTDKSSKGEQSPKDYKTSLDFKKPGARPW
jgi:hypothetical protein